MKKLTITALAAAITLMFSASTMANTMSKAEFKAAHEKIEADYKIAKTACEPSIANAKDICMAEAMGKKNVAMADLEATDEPTAKHRYEARIAKAKAEYSVAKEKCDDKAGNAKDVCVKEAKATYTSAKADAKTQLEGH